jgi:hypothetical protein
MALKHHKNNDISIDHGAYGEASDYHTRKIIIKIKCVKHKKVINVSSYSNSTKVTVSVDLITYDGQNLRIKVFRDVMLCSLVDKHYLHGIISQETKITITTIIRTSNLTEIV